MRIHLFHVNDVHSQLENYMRLGNQLRQMREAFEANGEIVLTFDIGDVLDRVRPETEASMGMVNADMMAALGVDGWVFGNNEGLTIPVEDWPNLVKRSKTRVFLSNFKQADDEAFPFFVDSAILERQGIRIGVFGISPNYQLPYDMLGVHTKDPMERTEQMVNQLVSEECDVIICLSHLGRKADLELAKRTPRIDVILGGHTHEFMPEAERIGKTAIFQPGKHGRVFGHTELELDETHRVRDVHSSPIQVSHDTPLDTLMERAYQHHAPYVDKVLKREVVTLTERLDVVYERESTFANLLCDVLNDEFQGDFTIMMTGALNASLLPGKVQLQHLLGACPTPTRPITVTLYGRDIYDIFCQGIQSQTYNRRGIGFGFRGGKIGYLVVSGLEVLLGRDDGGNQRIEAVVKDGVPIDADQAYRVTTCEYLWLSPVFASFRQSRDVDYQPPLVREVLFARMHEEGRLERAKQPRYREYGES